MTATRFCVKCSKDTTTLKNCAKCNGVSYCSKSCQKADWKTHKKICAHLAAARANGVQLKMEGRTGSCIPDRFAIPESDVLSVAVNSPFHKLLALTWMHGRSEKDVFKLLVDSWNFRKIEEYMALGVTEIIDDDPNATDGMARFRDYVVAASKKELLPSWWAKGKVEACIKYGLDGQNWSNLSKWIDEESLVEHYGTVGILFQLTLFAYQVLGSVKEGDDEKYEMTLKLRVALEGRECRG